MNDFFKYYSKNNFFTTQKIKQIAGYRELSNEKLLEKYNEAFLNLLKNAFNNSPFYKKMYRDHGIAITDIKDLTDIIKLPVVTRQMLQNHEDHIYTSLKPLIIKGFTSGTSGTPLTIYRTPKSVMTEQAYVRQYRIMHGYKYGQPMVSIRGSLDRQTDNHRYFKEANVLYISSPNINADTIGFFHKLIKDFNPVAVEAFPSYLYKTCQEMQKKGLEWNVPLTFTASETLFDFQREKIEDFLQTKIFDMYGNGERSIMLAQEKNLEYKPFPVYSINEFSETGILTTALTNNSFPFIRYEVKDKVIVNGTNLLENIVAPKIVQIEGRLGDTIDLKDGSVVACIDHAFKGIGHLEYAQVHQYTVDEPLEIKLVVHSQFGKEDLDLFMYKLKRMIGDTKFFITYCTYDCLTKNQSNKYKLIIKHNKPRG